jgi:hypothetical protein
MTALFIGEVEVADENRHDYENVFLTQPTKNWQMPAPSILLAASTMPSHWLVFRRKTDTSSFNSTVWTRCKSGGRDQPALL